MEKAIPGCARSKQNNHCIGEYYLFLEERNEKSSLYLCP